MSAFFLAVFNGGFRQIAAFWKGETSIAQNVILDFHYARLILDKEFEAGALIFFRHNLYMLVSYLKGQEIRNSES